MLSNTRIGRSLWWGLLAPIMASVLLTGCGSEQSSDQPEMVSAESVLNGMLAAYRQADHYQDRAVVRLQYRRDGQDFADEAPLGVCWESPNRLAVHAYQAHVVCDGQQLTARIQDEATRDFDGQVVVRQAPARLTLQQLWEEDEILSVAFQQGLAGFPLQLDLLLSPTPLAALTQEGTDTTLLEPARVDGNPCHRLKVATTGGPFVLWVDQQSHVLRRIEYPAQAFAPEIAEDESVQELQLTVECRAASFEKCPDATMFSVTVPANATQVRRLILPPRQLPSDLFGKEATPYSFATLEGETITQQSLGQRIKVFAWFNNHPACQSTIQQLNQVYQQYRENERIDIRAVCAEAASVTNDQIVALANSWRVELPLVRDSLAVGRDLFAIPWAPSLIVLNEQDVVQIYEVGANPNLIAELPQILEQLLAGSDIAGEILDQFRQEQAEYERALARGEPAPLNLVGATPVADHTQPQALQLRPLWNNNSLQAAGNILAVADDQQQPRFLVFEGYRTITEWGAQGNRLGRHELDLPVEAGVTQLQSAVAASGKRYFVAWSPRSPQAHVFDASWTRVLSYPELSEQHDGVQDAVLADLDGDGQLELHIGFWGDAGVHCATLSGRRLWANQDATHVLSLISTAADERTELWATSASGAVTRLDYHGRGTPLASHSGLLTHQLFRDARAGHLGVPYCGISYGLEGRRLAVGLAADASSHWRYSLPAGSFASPVQFVTSAPLLDQQSSHWLIAAADGSVHIISADGRFTDHFQTGSPISGLAGGRLGEAGVLVVSSPDQLRAWQVSPPQTARAD